GATLLLSVQHPATRWSDFDPAMPPRPSVPAIRKAGGARSGLPALVAREVGWRGAGRGTSLQTTLVTQQLHRAGQRAMHGP
ncbi:MAG TPA: hypothetical protein VFY92_05540, partial [Hyphomicrobiaceae bacterium]|nr:hypothetical protein [Hyphomicrobiaceae bacterium]